MKGDEVIEDGTVVVDGNKIVAVGARSEVAVPKGAKAVDAKGKTILPGIVDVHWHGSQGTGDEIVPQQGWFNYAALTFGVTTIHDPSNDTSEFFAAAELQRAGQIVAPRLFSTGTILYGAAGDFKAVIDSLDDARAHLRRMQAAGAFSVKSYNQPRRDQRQQVIAAARELNMLVVPEGGSLFNDNMTQVVDGHYRGRARDPAGPPLRRRGAAVVADRGGLHPDPDRRLRRHLGRKLLVRQHRRLGRREGADLRPALRARPAGPPRPSRRRSRSTTISSWPKPPRSWPTRGSRSTSAPTASAKAWAPTGRCGCSSRAA